MVKQNLIEQTNKGLFELTEKGFDVANKNENLKANKEFNGLIVIATTLIALITLFNFLVEVFLMSPSEDLKIVLVIILILVSLILISLILRLLTK